MSHWLFRVIRQYTCSWETVSSAGTSGNYTMLVHFSSVTLEKIMRYFFKGLKKQDRKEQRQTLNWYLWPSSSFWIISLPWSSRHLGRVSGHKLRKQLCQLWISGGWIFIYLIQVISVFHLTVLALSVKMQCGRIKWCLLPLLFSFASSFNHHKYFHSMRSQRYLLVVTSCNMIQQSVNETKPCCIVPAMGPLVTWITFFNSTSFTSSLHPGSKILFRRWTESLLDRSCWKWMQPHRWATSPIQKSWNDTCLNISMITDPSVCFYYEK